jgi:hypothetical protein
MVKKEFEIKNKNTGLKSGDVLDCGDLLQLQEWLMEQHMDVASLEMQIEVIEDYKSDNGSYLDADHYRRVKRTYKLQKDLYKLIEMKIKYIETLRGNIMDAIINVVKANMTDEKWQQIQNEAEMILGEQSPFSTSLT